MTNTEAIKELEWVKERGFVADKGIIGTDRIVKAVGMAIEALEEQEKARSDAIEEFADLIESAFLHTNLILQMLDRWQSS